MIVVDTSGLLATLFPDRRCHAECIRIPADREGPFCLSTFVFAELDWLVASPATVDTEPLLLQ